MMTQPESTPDRIRDADRLGEIGRLGLLSEAMEEVLSELVREAAARLDLPTSLVSVVLDDAQHFAAAEGLVDWLARIGGTPIEWSFCANSVQTGEPFVVEDATRDEALKDNPLVRDEVIRCYAGVPLITSSGHTLGNLCVIGSSPRKFAKEDLAVLRELADEAMARIEGRAE